MMDDTLQVVPDTLCECGKYKSSTEALCRDCHEADMIAIAEADNIDELEERERRIRDWVDEGPNGRAICQSHNVERDEFGICYRCEAE